MKRGAADKLKLGRSQEAGELGEHSCKGGMKQKRLKGIARTRERRWTGFLDVGLYY